VVAVARDALTLVRALTQKSGIRPGRPGIRGHQAGDRAQVGARAVTTPMTAATRPSRTPGAPHAERQLHRRAEQRPGRRPVQSRRHLRQEAGLDLDQDGTIEASERTITERELYDATLGSN
jgi:hypothetical protein